MADLLSALREFRYLDEKRMLGALAPAEQQRWDELRAVVSPHTQPAVAPAASMPASQVSAEEPTTVGAPAMEVEPPFVDAELTEDAPSDEPMPSASPSSAFDRLPIPQAPIGAEPMLLESERPATDFEPTQVGVAEQAPHTDFDATVAGPLPLTDVAPMALTEPAPAPEPEPEPEPMLLGMQPVSADLQEDVAIAGAAANQEGELASPAPPVYLAPEPTQVVARDSAPWREFSSPPASEPSEEDAAEADFFKHFGSQQAAEPVAPSAEEPHAEPSSSSAESPLSSWPQPQALPPADAPVLAPEHSPLEVPSETVATSYVPGEQRVVVHTLEGLQTRGFLSETDLTRHAILLRKQSGGEQWLNIEELKAVFFLLGPDQQPSPAQGQRVNVKLRDGRTLTGNALDPGSQAVGFYLFPEDGNTRIDRIFLYLAAIKDIAPG